MKTIILTAAAEKQLLALPRDVQGQIADALDLYAMTGRGDIKALKGRNGYRLRVGRYRVIFEEDAATVLAIDILKRDSATYR